MKAEVGSTTKRVDRRTIFEACMCPTGQGEKDSSPFHLKQIVIVGLHGWKAPASCGTGR